MMRVLSRLVLGILIVAGAIDAQPPKPGGSGSRLILSEQRPQLFRPQRDAEPWLGISVHKSSEAVHATLKEIPEGVGFVVSEVVPGSPAARSGLRKFDFLWMLNGQMLINEAQFLVLLNLHKVGESVRLTIQRGENTHEVAVLLSKRPSSETGRTQAEILIMKGPPMPDLPHQLVQRLRQVASIKDEDGVLVRLERRGSGFRWQQIDPEGSVMLQDDLTGLSDPNFPSGGELPKKLRALIRAVEDARTRAQNRNRRPRVRRVPTGDVNKVPKP